MDINSISDNIVQLLLMTAMVLYTRPKSENKDVLTQTSRQILKKLFYEGFDKPAVMAFIEYLFCTCNGDSDCLDGCLNKAALYDDEDVPYEWIMWKNNFKEGLSDRAFDQIMVRMNSGNISEIRMNEYTVGAFIYIIEVVHGVKRARELLINRRVGKLPSLMIPHRPHLVVNIFTELEERFKGIHGAQPIFGRIYEIFGRICKKIPKSVSTSSSKPIVGSIPVSTSVLPLYPSAAVAPTPAPIVRSGSYPSTANVAPVDRLSGDMQHSFAVPGGLPNALVAGKPSLPTPAPVVRSGSHPSTTGMAPLDLLCESMQHYPAAPVGVPNALMARNSPSLGPFTPVNLVPHTGRNETLSFAELKDFTGFKQKNHNKKPPRWVAESATPLKRKTPVRARAPPAQSAPTLTRPTMQSTLDGDARAAKIRRISGTEKHSTE